MKSTKKGTIIAISNQKGGVAKTTSVQHLGYALAQNHGLSVLMIDLDPQGNLTSVFGIQPGSLNSTMLDVLKGDIPLSQIIHETNIQNGKLDLAPANIELSVADIELVSEINATYLLKSAITPAFTEDEDAYDFILIDCPPSLGILTVNAFACANYIMVPVQPEMYAMEGLQALENTISKVRLRANANLKVLGWFITLHDGRTRIHRDVAALFKQRYGAELFDTVISVNTTIREAQAARKTVLQYDSSRTGAQNYSALTIEVLQRVGV